MNDFTKEELEEILQQMKHGHSFDDFSYACMDKIKSLIDDYCEHKHVVECADCEVLRCGHCMKARRK